MKITRLKLPLLILGLIGVCGLILPIHSGDAGSRLAANLSNKITAGSSSGQWVWQNPLPQGNTLQDFSFIDTTNGFAVGARGTILRTTDGGNNWDILASDTNDDLYGVSFIGFKYRNSCRQFWSHSKNNRRRKSLDDSERRNDRRPIWRLFYERE